jgi:hypothetical protein
MKELPERAPEIHEAFMGGAFVGHRADGCTVSPNMLLEQIYNLDAKEESGLDGITLNATARLNWVDTKPLTAVVSGELCEFFNLTKHTDILPHEVSKARKVHDNDLLDKIKTDVKENPCAIESLHMINISNGEHADVKVANDLLNIKKIEEDALKNTIKGKHKIV